MGWLRTKAGPNVCASVRRRRRRPSVLLLSFYPPEAGRAASHPAAAAAVSRLAFLPSFVPYGDLTAPARRRRPPHPRQGEASPRPQLPPAGRSPAPILLTPPTPIIPSDSLSPPRQAHGEVDAAGAAAAPSYLALFVRQFYPQVALSEARVSIPSHPSQLANLFFFC
jgi:hypothetical protein